MDNPPPMATGQQWLEDTLQISERNRLLEIAFQSFLRENPEATETQKQHERVRLFRQIKAWQER